VWNRQRTDLGELREPFDPGKNKGSSTLAFKRNPFHTEWIRSIAALVKHRANGIRDLSMEDERDGTRFAYYREVVPTASVMTDAVVIMLTDVLADLDVKTDRMRENMDQTRGFIMGENVMMTLAERGAGRQTAHDIIDECATLALEEDLDLVEALQRDGRVLEYLSAEEITALTDPEEYLGETVARVERTIDDVRTARRTGESNS